MFVTRHSPVTDPALREQLWSLYERAYERTAESSPTHEMLYRSEFSDQLGDSANRTWVVWDDSTPVAMTLVSTDIKRTRWLSEHYFRRNFPDQFRAGRVHYVVWAVIDPGYTTRGASMFLARQAMAVEAREGTLLVFDMPEENQPLPGGGAAELMYRMAKTVGGADLLPLTVQRYYALDFSRNEQFTSESPVEENSEAFSR